MASATDYLMNPANLLFLYPEESPAIILVFPPLAKTSISHGNMISLMLLKPRTKRNLFLAPSLVHHPLILYMKLGGVATR